jgi:hypothetical protein
MYLLYDDNNNVVVWAFFALSFFSDVIELRESELLHRLVAARSQIGHVLYRG